MSSIFVIAKTSPGAGLKKIFKIFQSPKYDNYIWHAAYEIEKEFYISFSNDKYVWHAAYEFEKRCSTLVFKWQIYLARGLWNGKIRSQMTNIFGIRLSRNKTANFQMTYIFNIRTSSKTDVITISFVIFGLKVNVLGY